MINITWCGYGHDQGTGKLTHLGVDGARKHTRRFDRQDAVFANEPYLQAIRVRCQKQLKQIRQRFPTLSIASPNPFVLSSNVPVLAG